MTAEAADTVGHCPVPGRLCGLGNMGSALASRLRLEFAALGFDVVPAKRAAGADPPQVRACEQLAELATAEGCGRLDYAAVAKPWKQWLGTSLATKSEDEA